MARTENGQLVPRVVVLRLRSMSVEVGGFQDLSHAYVTTLLPLDFVVDLRVINAYPRVDAQVLMAVTSASRDAQSASGGRQSLGNEAGSTAIGVSLYPVVKSLMIVHTIDENL